MAPVVQVSIALLSLAVNLVHASPQTAQHLTQSLFVFNDTACESDSLHLRCPHGTAIDVISAQYGRQLPGWQRCPSLSVRPGEANSRQGNTNCHADTSLLKRQIQVVLELCQDQRQCKVTADTATFGQDPCPGSKKHLQVAYRCKPNEFQTRVTCEGEEMILKCQKNKVLAIFSAMFGRSDQGHMECPAQRQVGRVCKSTTAMKKVIDSCHGNKNCNIPSDTRIFGDPCEPETPKYLRVVFVCVPKRIMKPVVAHYDETHEYEREYDTRDENKPPPGGASGGLAGPGERKERIGPGLEIQPAVVPKQTTDNYNMAAGMSPTKAPSSGGLNSNEKLILYIVVGVLAGCLIIMFIVISKLVHDKRRKKRKSKRSPVTTEMDKPCQTTLTLTPTNENTYSHHITTPADTFLEHSTNLNDTIDIMQYNLRSLTSQPPTLGRHSPNSLNRAHYRDSPNRAFHSESKSLRSINSYYR